MELITTVERYIELQNRDALGCLDSAIIVQQPHCKSLNRCSASDSTIRSHPGFHSSPVL